MSICPLSNELENQAIRVCNRCRKRLKYESDKRNNGYWYKSCSHCRSSARDYQRGRKEMLQQASRHNLDEPDPPNRPRKLQFIQPRSIPVTTNNATLNNMGNGLVQPRSTSAVPIEQPWKILRGRV
jgi:hypothetical protein